MRRDSFRRRRRSRADGGSSWISYSDMMAALLLLFVLVLCSTMYHFLVSLQTKTDQLDEQAALLSAQEITLSEQEKELAGKQAEIDTQSAELSRTRAQLDGQQALLDAQALTLSRQQSDIEAATAALSLKEDELAAANAALASREAELNDSQAKIAQQQDQLAAQQARLDDLVGVRTKIVRELTSSLSKNHINASVDPNTGDIMLESAVFFEFGKNELTDGGKTFLRRFIPVYLEVLLRPENREYLGEIIIEGHTDSSGTYKDNLKLSQQRALSVANFCLDMDGLSGEDRRLFQSILTVTGKSYSSLVYDENGEEDADASRRVEFKFRLRDTEMIEEIRGILSSDEGKPQ